MSKFQLMTKDQEDLVAMVHDFMEKKVDPYVDQWDRESHCPMDEVRELMDLGFWGIDVPEEYGGAGLDVTTIMYLSPAPMPATARPRLSRTAMSMSSPAARPSSPTAVCPTCIP